jgi:hypothetical protein
MAKFLTQFESNARKFLPILKYQYGDEPTFLRTDLTELAPLRSGKAEKLLLNSTALEL